MVKNVDDFDKLRYNNSKKYEQLKREYRTIGKINKQSENVERDIKTYYDFRKEDIETTYHFIYDYYKRMYKNDRSQNFSFENIVDVSKLNPNFYDKETKRNIRSYNIKGNSKNKLILISEEGTDEMVSMRYGREKKTWEKKD